MGSAAQPISHSNHIGVYVWLTVWGYRSSGLGNHGCRGRRSCYIGSQEWEYGVERERFGERGREQEVGWITKNLTAGLPSNSVPSVRHITEA